jgi:hypothetical protein
VSDIGGDHSLPEDDLLDDFFGSPDTKPLRGADDMFGNTEPKLIAPEAKEEFEHEP